MKLTQIRNATVRLDLGAHRFLVDPMLSPPSALPGFRLFRGQRRRNPLVPLPNQTERWLDEATGVLITHEHPDHLDPPGVAWIKARGLTTWASGVDVPNLRRKGLDAHDIATDGPDGLRVEVVPGIHGHGLIGWLMGPSAGFHLVAPDEPTVYVTGDTVLSEPVRAAIQRLRPEVVIAPAGTANFGLGRDLMFSETEIVELAQLAPGHLVFNHLEAIDHCPMPRAKLRSVMDAAGVGDRVHLPQDGERVDFVAEAATGTVPPAQSHPRKPGLQKWLTAWFAGT